MPSGGCTACRCALCHRRPRREHAADRRPPATEAALRGPAIANRHVAQGPRRRPRWWRPAACQQRSVLLVPSSARPVLSARPTPDRLRPAPSSGPRTLRAQRLGFSWRCTLALLPHASVRGQNGLATRPARLDGTSAPRAHVLPPAHACLPRRGTQSTSPHASLSPSPTSPSVVSVAVRRPGVPAHGRPSACPTTASSRRSAAASTCQPSRAVPQPAAARSCRLRHLLGGVAWMLLRRAPQRCALCA